MAAHIPGIILIAQQKFLFREPEAVPAVNADGIAFPSVHDIVIIIPVKPFHVACIKIVDGAVLHKSGTRIHAMGV